MGHLRIDPLLLRKKSFRILPQRPLLLFLFLVLFFLSLSLPPPAPHRPTHAHVSAVWPHGGHTTGTRAGARARHAHSRVEVSLSPASRGPRRDTTRGATTRPA